MDFARGKAVMVAYETAGGISDSLCITFILQHIRHIDATMFWDSLRLNYIHIHTHTHTHKHTQLDQTRTHNGELKASHCAMITTIMIHIADDYKSS